MVFILQTQQEVTEFEVSLDYTKRTCLKTENKQGILNILLPYIIFICVILHLQCHAILYVPLSCVLLRDKKLFK